MYRIEKDYEPWDCEKKPLQASLHHMEIGSIPHNHKLRVRIRHYQLPLIANPHPFKYNNSSYFYYSILLRTIRRSNVSPEISLLVKRPASYTSLVYSKSYENTIVEGAAHRINLR